jgi:2-iminobutanoate/2-iminopropanoate deaminase
MEETIKTDRPYSPGYRAGDFIFVSGQGPSDPRTGKIQGDTIEEQTKQALENIKAILGANGASLKDVVKVTVVLTDVTNFKRMNEVYRTFFSKPFPARICYGGQLASPNMLVEIDAIACLKK